MGIKEKLRERFLKMPSIFTFDAKRIIACPFSCHLERSREISFFPVIPSVVEGSHEISPCAPLSRDDKGKCASKFSTHKIV